MRDFPVLLMLLLEKTCLGRNGSRNSNRPAGRLQLPQRGQLSRKNCPTGSWLHLTSASGQPSKFEFRGRRVLHDLPGIARPGFSPVHCEARQPAAPAPAAERNEPVHASQPGTGREAPCRRPVVSACACAGCADLLPKGDNACCPSAAAGPVGCNDYSGTDGLWTPVLWADSGELGICVARGLSGLLL